MFNVYSTFVDSNPSTTPGEPCINLKLITFYYFIELYKYCNFTANGSH